MSAISNNNYYYSASTIHSALEKAVSSLSENVACYSSDPVSDFTLQTTRHTVVTIHSHAMVLISISLTIQMTKRPITSIHLRPEDTISFISMHFMMY